MLKNGFVRIVLQGGSFEFFPQMTQIFLCNLSMLRAMPELKYQNIRTGFSQGRPTQWLIRRTMKKLNMNYIRQPVLDDSQGTGSRAQVAQIREYRA